MTQKEAIKNHLRRFRRTNDLTQQDLAERVTRTVIISDGEIIEEYLADTFPALDEDPRSATGTARAQTSLRITLASVGAIALTRPQVFVGGARTKFDEAGNLTDDDTRPYITRLLNSLAELTASLASD